MAGGTFRITGIVAGLLGGLFRIAGTIVDDDVAYS